MPKVFVCQKADIAAYFTSLIMEFF